MENGEKASRLEPKRKLPKWALWFLARVFAAWFAFHALLVGILFWVALNTQANRTIMNDLVAIECKIFIEFGTAVLLSWCFYRILHRMLVTPVAE